MLAKNEPIFKDAAETLYNLNSDETIRAQCRAHEDYNRQQSAIKYHIKEITTENQQLASENQQLASKVEQLTSRLKDLEDLLAAQNKE
jgi:predicted nuclease with TOPRIM domain